MKFHTQEVQTRGRGMIMLVGDPGAGKTLTASTAPAPIFIDVEDRASHTGCPRAVPSTHDHNGYREIVQFIKMLKGLIPDKDGFCHVNMGDEVVKAKTVILDTVDHLQMIYWTAKSDNWNKLGSYGDMKDEFVKDLLLPLLSISMNVIVVCHAKRIAEGEEHERKKGEKARIPTLGLSLAGSIRDILPGYFDNIIYLINDSQTGTSKIITNKGIHDNTFIPAKDTLNVFKGATFPVTFENGKPVRVMREVFDMIDTSRVEAQRLDATIKRVKKEWMEKAKEVGLMENPQSPSEMAEFKNVLGDLLVQIDTEPDVAGPAGLELISAWTPETAVETADEQPKKRATKLKPR